MLHTCLYIAKTQWHCNTTGATSGAETAQTSGSTCVHHRSLVGFMQLDLYFSDQFVIDHCNQINTTGATSGAGTDYPSGAPEFTPEFQQGSCYQIFSFFSMFCSSLFVLLYFLFWPLCCLFFFELRLLITSLVSSNSSFSFVPFLVAIGLHVCSSSSYDF